MRSILKVFSLVLMILLVVGIVLFGAYRYYYPYGSRTCFLPCMLGALRTYASEHDDAFPMGTNAYDALAKLQPRYVGGSIEILAGLSGDRSGVVERINVGQPFGSNECSWVYFPDLRTTDDPKLMLLYERSSGVRFDGMRSHGRAVGFVDNQFSQILDQDWDKFMAEQARLRAEVLAKRDKTKN